MNPVKKVNHISRGQNFELHVFKVVETDTFRVFVSKGALGLGPIYEVSQNVVSDAQVSAGVDLLAGLIDTIKGDIDRNDFGDF